VKCSQCQSCETKVIESRDVADGEAIRRRRECSDCDYRFTTYERLERPELVVVKKDGTRELFSREKLLAGLQRACQKTSVTGLQLETVAARVERELYDLGEAEIPSKKIGERVMESLANLDDVAYVRFASVYRRFKDIASFEAELAKIREKRAKPVSSKSLV
jgi:transcriptional repressor NrdR